ncbi:hypothetical protein, partial [Herbaspirillum sp. C7C2]|uniref:hypothetical protein n=1 Tax=Herbaspirillum sp. C7C2 TaxID=2736666 RepID=UPI00237A59EE
VQLFQQAAKATAERTRRGRCCRCVARSSATKQATKPAENATEQSTTKPASLTRRRCSRSITGSAAAKQATEKIAQAAASLRLVRHR